MVPVLDEARTVESLARRVAVAAQRAGHPFELIFVDDGSRDDSWERITDLARRAPAVRGLRMRCNVGKARALDAGMRTSRGAVLVTLDADLQDDPRELPRLLAELEAGADLVCGWKRRRHDPWHKVLASRVFNAMIRASCGTTLRDHNCGLKVMRAAVARELTLYGDLHRLVPVLAAARGWRIAEVAVRHFPRRAGRSKYGVGRIWRGLVDLATVAFSTRYHERPAHAFAAMGVFTLMAGALGSLAPVQLTPLVLGVGIATALFALALSSAQAVERAAVRPRGDLIAEDTAADSRWPEPPLDPPAGARPRRNQGVEVARGRGTSLDSAVA